MTDWSFYKNKKILITGHTGFKGSWMCRFLLELGADVTGYALKPPTEPSLFDILGLNERMESVIGDVRDLERLEQVIKRVQPELVIHMAAQPIVRESYKNPVYTYDVNVMGTVNILECVRQNDCVRSFLNVTTDKVYRNHEWEWGYRENEELNGYDPYSNSKSCSELVTASYINSFFGKDSERTVAISTARAGNVIGGGDFATDRIIPDCYRGVATKRAIEVRNPNSIRPYQHVLEPVAVYLMILQKQYEDQKLAGNYNVGPDESACRTTGELVSIFCKNWEDNTGEKAEWLCGNADGPHEANYLKLDCSKLKRTFAWKPCWSAEETLQKTVEWYAAYHEGKDMDICTKEQICEFVHRWKEQEN